MPRLIATDLDGTLLNEEHVVTAHAVAAIRKLHARGHVFVIASGRHYVDIVGVREIIGVPAYIISSNGARVHAPDGRPVYEKNIAPAVVRALRDADLDAGIVRNVFTSSQWFIDREAPALLEFHKDSGFRYRVAEPRAFPDEGVAKFLFAGEPAALAALEKAIVAAHGESVAMTYSLPHCLEAMATGVSKGAALRSVMAQVGVAPEAVMAFGDNLNDVEMLRLAGHPHVMGNAHPRLFELFPAAQRIGCNTQDAVADTLHRLAAR